jgi:hypothetical protein
MLDMLSRKAGAVAARAVARVPRFGILSKVQVLLELARLV